MQLRNGLLCKLHSMVFMILIMVFVSENSAFVFHITESVVFPSLIVLTLSVAKLFLCIFTEIVSCPIFVMLNG